MRKSAIESFFAPLIKCVVLFLMLILVAWFLSHIMRGQQSFSVFFNLRQDIEQARQRLDELQEERFALEVRVKSLYPESLDLDFLEERARIVLHMGLDDEIVILLDDLD